MKNKLRNEISSHFELGKKRKSNDYDLKVYTHAHQDRVPQNMCHVMSLKLYMGLCVTFKL